MRNKAPWPTMLGHSFHQFHDNDLFTSAAAMSYFGLLTLFPGLILLLAIGKKLTAGSIMVNEMMRRVVQVYPGSEEFLGSTIRSLSDLGTGVIITCIIVVLWAGSWVFAVVERALNRIWHTTSRKFLHGRALTLGMIGIVGLLLTVSVLFTSILLSLQHYASRFDRWSWLATFGGVFWQVIFALVSIFVTIVLFMLVYRFMPNARVSLRDTVPGAIIAGLLWEGAKYIFAWSLHFFHYDQIYGSVGAVVAVLTWGYVSSLILLYGAQLTAVFHREHPSEPLKPSAVDAAIAPAP
ncbi:MAG TPA: YihY/virulence factor BrkB family protein [Pyrinomonadaceae bacterium]